MFQTTAKPYRESFIFADWRVETFIHNEYSYFNEFENERIKGRPVLGNMISEGKLLKDSQHYKSVKEKAILHVSNGPLPLSKDFINASRYFIGDLLDDFNDAKNHEEALLSINKLSLEVPDFILRLNHHWSGRGKALTKALRLFNEETYHDFFHALNEFYKNDDKKPFVEFVNKVYEPVGGLLFEGFASGKK